MKFIYTLSIFSFLAIFSFNAIGQGFLKAEGKRIVNEDGDNVILRGMGLGGWMLQEGYMLQTAGFANAQYQIRNKIEGLIGESNTDLFYEKWLDNHVRKIDIDSLKAWGFNSVRLPLHYKLFTLPIEEEPVVGGITWLDKGFELTDSLISWCKQNEMYVVLDLHGAPGGQGQDQGISDYDPTKPSLWQSQRNRDKAVELWRRLAERYKDETWVAGYDLLNEPNWNLPGGTALRSLYEDMTGAIRSVDNNHILFIEGNWFANDFTGLLPPWDDNIVYAPHKYWSENFTADIQWVLTIRDQYNVPLYFGESGENSNTWFRDAIKLIEDHNIGWAWWPMKKIESISGPLSIVKTPEYQSLLDFWNGGGSAPTQQFALTALMGLTEQLKLENCIYQKDVIDAMFRQVQSVETVPFRNHTVPGIIYASDFDMGILGSAYHDVDVATYHVTTGNYTAWNTGWAYRNDGVDVQPLIDNVNSNGFNVGWINQGEWMQYNMEVENDAVYEVKVRLASNSTNGKFHFNAGGVAVSEMVETPNTGGWDNWETTTVPNVVLTKEDKKLVFYTDNEGFNLSSFEFVEKAHLNSISTEFLAAKTLDENTVQLVLNKPLTGPVNSFLNDFVITVNGGNILIENIALDASNNRVVDLDVNHQFMPDQTIKISYTGNEIKAIDDTPLNVFTLRDVENTIPAVHLIPGKIEAEGYFHQQGIVLENSSDTGGGQNAGFLDVGDYMDYLVRVTQGGVYKVDYRHASDGGTGQIIMQLLDANGIATDLHTVNFASTGGWQDWETKTATVNLMQGAHHVRILITQPQFNLNWYHFSFLTPNSEQVFVSNLNVFPNPSADQFLVQGEFAEKQNAKISIYNLLGQEITSRRIENELKINEKMDLSNFPDGQYFLCIKNEKGLVQSKKIIKAGK